MNFKKRFFLIGLGVMLILAFLLHIGLVTFFSPGVHIFGSFAHVEFQENCYFLDTTQPIQEISATDITGSSTFTIVGTLYHRPNRSNLASPFSGHMEVETYPISLADGFAEYSGQISHHWITLSCQGRGFDDALFYTVDILRSNPEVVLIYVHHEDATVSTAVCGRDEADALEHYQQYLSHRFS